MKQNMLERLFKMLGNISKKKGDNGDFYTKPVIDKKLKDTETAVRAYTNEAVANAKNDLYAEVGEKVGAVEETVKAKLDSTDTKLDTKVDKVSGKGLVDETDIRTAVQSDNLTLADEKKITLRSTESGDTGTNVINAVGMTVGYNNMKTTIGCDSARLSFTDTNENVFINPNDVTINQGGKTVHKLSEKANSSDVFLKSGDVVLADGKKVSLSSSESGNDGTLTIRPTGISLSRDTSMGTNDVAVSAYSGISVGGYGVDISINTIDGEQHKLSEKADKAEVFLPSKDIALESGKKISITNSNDTMVATLSGEELKIAEKDNDYKYARISANDVEVKTYYTDETNDPVFVTHKLSEKVNASDVLTKTNTAEFTPTADYQPATKKYVDDIVIEAGGGDMLKSVYDKDNDGIIDDVALLQYYGITDITISDSSYFTVNETGETITGLTDTGKTQTELVIPYAINGKKITTLFSGSNGQPVSILNGNSTITKVMIPKSVTTLGRSAFFSCRSLTSIDIPNSVTSIGDYAFAACRSLTSINLPNGVTSIGKEVFSGCSGLKSINLPNGVTSIGERAFLGCTSLTSINIPNSVTSIEEIAFSSCTNLKIYCEQGSYAETFAKGKNISVVYTDIKDDVLHELSEKVNASDVGALSTLATTNKSSIVAAINELKAAIDELKGS